MAVSLTQSIRTKRTNAGNSMEEKINIISSGPVNLYVDEVEAAGRYTRSFLGGLVQDLNEETRTKASEVHTKNVDRKKRMEGKEGKAKKLNLGIQVDPISVIGEKQLLGSGPYDVVGNSNACNIMPGNASRIAVPSQEGPSRQHNVSTALDDDHQGKSVLKTPEDVTDTLDKLESSAESYLMVEASKHANPRTLHDHCKNGLQPECILLNDESVLADNYPELKGVEDYLRKGKGKALCDGEVNHQLAYYIDNNSQGSAGSCTSERLATSGKTKRSLDQQLTVNGKRQKQNMQGDPGSQSCIRQSSFFMSWITNMIKGYSGCDQEEPSSSTLCRIITHYELDSHKQKTVARGHEFSGMGFRNLFQSLYRSNNNEEGTRKMCLNNQKTEGSGDTKHSAMVDVSAVPLTAYRTRDNIPKKIRLSYEMCDQPTTGNVTESPSKKVMILPTNFPANEIKRLSEMKTISCNVGNGMEIVKKGSSSSSIGKWMARPSKYIKSKRTSEEKTAQDIGQRTDYLRSSWVTRFCPSISHSASMEDHHVTRMCISNSVIPSSENHGSFGGVLMSGWEHSCGKLTNVLSEGLNGFAKSEGFIGYGERKVKNEQKPEFNLEAVSSGSARRSDDLKQLIPFDATCKSAPLITNCFFCGVIGHDLQACSKITKMELDELFQRSNSYDQVKESPCLCIKCFQLNHWAIDCPQGPLRKSALCWFLDPCGNTDMYSNRSNKEKKSFMARSDHSASIPGPHRTSRGDCRMNKSIQLQDSGNLDQDIAEARNPTAMGAAGLEADESSSPSLFMGMPCKISVSVKGIFDALRRLRLSRSDFLRLMTARVSLSHLRGFYLRVRFSNCKQGLGEKGYYVACIHGALTEQAGPRTRLTVTIGSFTGLVESQYISNQDFLQDELVTWWTASAKAGHSQIPSLEELEQKYEERKRWLDMK